MVFPLDFLKPALELVNKAIERLWPTPEDHKLGRKERAKAKWDAFIRREKEIDEREKKKEGQ